MPSNTASKNSKNAFLTQLYYWSRKFGKIYNKNRNVCTIIPPKLLDLAVEWMIVVDLHFKEIVSSRVKQTSRIEFA